MSVIAWLQACLPEAASSSVAGGTVCQAGTSKRQNRQPVREDVPWAGFHRRLWETQNFEGWQVWWPRRELEDLGSNIIACLGVSVAVVFM